MTLPVFTNYFRDVRALLRDSTSFTGTVCATSWTRIQHFSTGMVFATSWTSIEIKNCVTSDFMCPTPASSLRRISVSHPLHFCGVGVTIFSLHIFSSFYFSLDQRGSLEKSVN